MNAHLILFCLCSLALSGYVNVFNDTFENMNNWQAAVESGQQTGNNELEYYTNRAVNVQLTNTANGRALQLHAQRESYSGYSYTSGKVHSTVQFGPYGFFNVRALVPKGNGLWPAIWMLPNGAHNVYGGWAACGEIDIMETICNNDPAYSTLHFGGPYPKNVQYPTGGNNRYPFSIDWSVPHNFGLEWQATYMTFWFDATIVNGQIQGTQILTVPSSKWYSENSSGQRYPGNAPFNVPTNMVLNVAIGGNWPCSVSGCCSNIAVPASMYIYSVQAWNNTQS